MPPKRRGRIPKTAIAKALKNGGHKPSKDVWFRHMVGYGGYKKAVVRYVRNPRTGGWVKTAMYDVKADGKIERVW